MDFALAKPIRGLVLISLALTLTACDELISRTPLPGTESPPPTAASQPEPSEVSRAMSEHYRRVEENLLSQGLLRADGGAFDAPYGAHQLAANFVRIALYDEYTQSQNGLVATPSASRLRRWETPVNLSVEFGETVTMAQRRRDIRDISAYATRLSRATGLPVRLSTDRANFHVLILNEDERLSYGPRLRELVPGISDSAVRTIVSMPRSTFCLVYAFAGRSDTAAFSSAIAVIRGEHPERLRQSCIHEELAQGMGLANDSPAARPSIFNDDEEFGLLTNHDTQLLRILYDPRLRIGMTEAEATPVVRTIAEEILQGS